MHAQARNGRKCASLIKLISVHIVATYVRVRARIIIKINMLINMYNGSLSFKFYEDPFIGCGEIAKTKPSMHTYHF